jgi:hypothetical protein
MLRFLFLFSLILYSTTNDRYPRRAIDRLTVLWKNPEAAMRRRTTTITIAAPWDSIQQLLLLTPRNIVTIQRKIETAPEQDIHYFIAALKRLRLQKVTPAKPLPYDARIVAAVYHKLLAENRYFRILWVTMKVGESNDPHTHQWPSVTLITSTGTRLITYTEQGEIGEDDESEPGIYEITGTTLPLGYTNCGPYDFHALSAELKETVPH